MEFVIKIYKLKNLNPSINIKKYSLIQKFKDKI
jgi:hypothetical protein